MTRISLIAAIDRAYAIGYDNRLPWSLPDDLRRFKRLTMGHTVLMGRKTSESIGRALPGRRNLVLTRSGVSPIAGMQAVASLDEVVAISDDELFVIGGGEIYALAMATAERMYLTHVDTTLEKADAWFPRIASVDWTVTSRAAHGIDERHALAFEFVDYIHKSSAP